MNSMTGGRNLSSPVPTRDTDSAPPPTDVRPARVALFAAACGIAVANIYCSQPLVGLIAPAVGLPVGLAGLIVALTQLGFGAGLLCLVPLSDVVENRRLVTWACGAVAIGLLGIAHCPIETIIIMLGPGAIC